MGIRIGFTVGVWDLFHQGHNNFLQECKKHCDFLHVGIMTDFWCQVQKGCDRPYYCLAKRIVDLRQHPAVDNIVVLDTLDMEPYLSMSHVWLKGEDQKNMLPIHYPSTAIIKRTAGVSSTDEITKRGQG